MISLNQTTQIEIRSHEVRNLFEFVLGECDTFSSLPPIFPIGPERHGLLSDRGGDRKCSACYLLPSH